MLYNRTGNFAQTTVLNTKLAEQFMQASDLRLDVVITDSDNKPEQSAVSVGSDVLAWRSMVPISELTKIVLRPKKYRQTQIVDGQYRLQIHDQIIDDDIRKRGYQDKDDYERRYLARLKAEVKGGLVEAIRWEKLGLRTQLPNYFPYIFAAANLPSVIHNAGLEGAVLFVGLTVFGLHPLYAYITNMAMQRLEQFRNFTAERAPDFRFPIPPQINPRDWKHALIPTVPVDKWYKGKEISCQTW